MSVHTFGVYDASRSQPSGPAVEGLTELDGLRLAEALRLTETDGDRLEDGETLVFHVKHHGEKHIVRVPVAELVRRALPSTGGILART